MRENYPKVTHHKWFAARHEMVWECAWLEFTIWTILLRHENSSKDTSLKLQFHPKKFIEHQLIKQTVHRIEAYRREVDDAFSEISFNEQFIGVDSIQALRVKEKLSPV